MDTLETEIKAVNARFMAAVGTGDEEGFVRLYTGDAVLLLPGREPLVGRAGIQAFFASFKARAIARIQLTTIEVEGVGDSAWEWGRSELSDAGGTIIGRGKYIVIWKRDSGIWKLHRDIMNPAP